MKINKKLITMILVSGMVIATLTGCGAKSGTKEVTVKVGCKRIYRAIVARTNDYIGIGGCRI